MKSQQGFSLIELIMVIILIGILSATAAARFSGRSAFDAQITRDQAISLIRQLQISAMNGHPQSLNIEQNCLGVCEHSLTDTNDSLRYAQTQTTFAMSQQPSGISLKSLSFNLLGQPTVSQSPTAALSCASGCTITITAKNNHQASICVNSQGYIYKKTDEACSQ
ncbi:type II secretion system protein [Photobacterium carnosum]|uniref:type II secretion system protein n=1 Tax=Photobacterium carnosum TaxID=2023717 RepID=UPI001E557468|nr:type II secretion system protein [Photobacterium carnosum]MCD9538503.1 prepilin-type N-terminal cleavage/methylation domain-containing protein [Photobacterium carnosum]MCF2162365.1 prepilin-type N-terminal cleavage/methylation domain-containing protein [Photobacterium carnosum]